VKLSRGSHEVYVFRSILSTCKNTYLVRAKMTANYTSVPSHVKVLRRL
jgi:hypothetical protein